MLCSYAGPDAVGAFPLLFSNPLDHMEPDNQDRVIHGRASLGAAFRITRVLLLHRAHRKFVIPAVRFNAWALPAQPPLS
jgi:hypothetical protein